MINFLSDVQIFFFWLFVPFVFLDGVLILARHFIKDQAIEKKRIFLFYCSLGITMALVFLMSLIPYDQVRFADQTIWNLSVVLGATGAVIMGFLIFYSYNELWLQPKKRKTK